MKTSLSILRMWDWLTSPYSGSLLVSVVLVALIFTDDVTTAVCSDIKNFGFKAFLCSKRKTVKLLTSLFPRYMLEHIICVYI